MLDWDIWLVLTVIAKFVIYLTSFLAVGSLLFLWTLNPASDEIKRQLLKLTVLAALLSVIATFIRISLQAGQLYDDGLVGMYDLEMIELVVDGPLGLSSLIRFVGLVLLFIAIFAPITQTPLTIVSGFSLAVSFAFVGHATSDQIILGVLITIHLLAVSYWLGGLYPLHKMASSNGDLKHAGQTAHKFGKQASIIVPILIVVGVAFAVRLTGSPVNLFGTEYGLLLLLKIVVVAGLLLLAAMNKLKLVPRLLEGDVLAARQLQTSIKVEFVVFLAIFVITAILTSAVNLPEH
ncbi:MULTISPECIES: copper resistance D family protein [unclassified Lentilitoribacter]|uniref:copper resistance D family protein n=1 Tax=unclassified Lentilitoribacter TaxID=2647570 RepID=UPI0013A68ABA|nr:CopD family protein [Lentilitoribacter sp. Alg239-R112]